MESELAKALSMLKDATISAALLAVLFGAFTRKWVPGVYYMESQARNSKLESLVELAHDAADRATRVSEETLRMVRELQEALITAVEKQR
jgi:hypothetical protein